MITPSAASVGPRRYFDFLPARVGEPDVFRLRSVNVREREREREEPRMKLQITVHAPIVKIYRTRNRMRSANDFTPRLKKRLFVPSFK